MSFTWHFYTLDTSADVSPRRCYRGSMIDVEQVMSVPFKYMTGYNTLRKRLLDDIVDTTLVAVQTREVVLRTLNSLIGPLFLRLTPQKKGLQVLICEKRNSIDIEADLVDLSPFYISAAKAFHNYNIPPQQIDLILAGLTSNSPVMNVAGKCAVVLLAAFIELDYFNG